MERGRSCPHECGRNADTLVRNECEARTVRKQETTRGSPGDPRCNHINLIKPINPVKAPVYSTPRKRSNLIYGRTRPAAEDRRLPRVVSQVRRPRSCEDRRGDARARVAGLYKAEPLRTHTRRTCDAGLAGAIWLGPGDVHRRDAETQRKKADRSGRCPDDLAQARA